MDSMDVSLPNEKYGLPIIWIMQNMDSLLPSEPHHQPRIGRKQAPYADKRYAELPRLISKYSHIRMIRLGDYSHPERVQHPQNPQLQRDRTCSPPPQRFRHFANSRSTQTEVQPAEANKAITTNTGTSPQATVTGIIATQTDTSEASIAMSIATQTESAEVTIATATTTTSASTPLLTPTPDDTQPHAVEVEDDAPAEPQQNRNRLWNAARRHCTPCCLVKFIYTVTVSVMSEFHIGMPMPNRRNIHPHFPHFPV